MLNGRNWWTDAHVNFEYVEGQNEEARIRIAAEEIWADWFDHEQQSDTQTMNLDHFVQMVEQVIKLSRSIEIKDRKSE